MNHFLDINKPTRPRCAIIDTPRDEIARNGRPKGAPDDDQPLKDHMVALIFEKPSTRTRVSFDVGVRQMGGQTMVLSGSEMQLGHGETIADTARVLSRYVDLIMIRTFEEDVLLELAEYATVPVINGLTEPHPSLPDHGRRDDLRGTSRPHRGQEGRLVRRRQQRLRQLRPCRRSVRLRPHLLGPRDARPRGGLHGRGPRKGRHHHDRPRPERAVEGADLVVTDTWVSMHDSQSARNAATTSCAPTR
jgi:ornithine carbamoyltransferase